MESYFLAVIAHLLIVITPGPANITIMHQSLANGRLNGIFTAIGVVSGSAMWAIIVVLSLMFSVAMSPQITSIITYLGSFYLFYLGYKIFQGRDQPVQTEMGMVDALSYGENFIRGFLVHALNPKAFFGWLAIISIGSLRTLNYQAAITIVSLCLFQATVIFCGYGLLFSTNRVIISYRKYKPKIDAFLGFVMIMLGVLAIIGDKISSILSVIG